MDVPNKHEKQYECSFAHHHKLTMYNYFSQATISETYANDCKEHQYLERWTFNI